MKLVKAVWADITHDEVCYQSLMHHEPGVRIVYRGGDWIYPTIPGSGIFVYENLLYAVMAHGTPVIKELPFSGRLFFWCLGSKVRTIRPLIRDAPAEILELYWNYVSSGNTQALWDDKDGRIIPWFYRYRRGEAPLGVLVAERIYLGNIVNQEDLAPFLVDR